MVAMVKAGVELAFEVMVSAELSRNLPTTNHFTKPADCQHHRP